MLDGLCGNGWIGPKNPHGKISSRPDTLQVLQYCTYITGQIWKFTKAETLFLRQIGVSMVCTLIVDYVRLGNWQETWLGYSY